ncbi:hypothetical protein JOM56_004462 [Amanita muscaria]
MKRSTTSLAPVNSNLRILPCLLAKPALASCKRAPSSNRRRLFIREEQDKFRQNVLDSTRALVLYMRKTGQQCTQHSNCKILHYQLEINGSKELYFSPKKVADAIHQFHKDPAVCAVSFI